MLCESVELVRRYKGSVVTGRYGSGWTKGLCGSVFTVGGRRLALVLSSSSNNNNNNNSNKYCGIKSYNLTALSPTTNQTL